MSTGTGLPVGVVTFLFTDVVGSTRLWETDAAVMGPAMTRHDELVETAVQAAGGVLVRPRGEGDSRFAVFTSPAAALTAATQVNLALAAEVWATTVPIRVRVAVGTGEADLRAGDYYGDVVNRVARLRAAGHPGQMLVADTTAQLAGSALPAGTTLVDLGVHRLKDLSRPERVYQLTHPQLAGEFPALVTLDRAKHNLPVQLSSFVGRDDEVRRVRELLAEHRLVTITGFGGMGKTRLALQVGAELADGDGDGVWFIDLSAATDPARVPAAIAETLGISETGDGPAAAVSRWLADKRLLLIVDNLEQITGCAPFVAELLAAAPQLRILATSRAPLHVRGEHDYELQPLSVGSTGAATGDPQQLSAFAAVRLFVDRAVEARHEFSVTNENAPAVAAICNRLDGHPLSIELAAARVKILTPQALLARLDSALSVLTSTGGDRPDRQQTLRATIAWSYDTLSAHEQLLLDCLSVFPGTTTLDAVEAICAPVVSGADILDTVSSLVDKSLVRTHEPTDTDPDTRFSLLVSIRDFASEQLAARGLVDEITRRAADYFTDVCRYPVGASPEQSHNTVSKAVRDLHNVRAALAYWQACGTVDEEADFFCGAVFDVLVSYGHFAELISCAEQFLSRNPSPSVGTVEVHNALEVTYDLLGQGEKSQAANDRLRADAGTLDRADLVAKGAINHLWFAQTAREAEAWLREAEQAVAAVPETGNLVPRWEILTWWRFAVYDVLRYVDPQHARAAAEEICTSPARGMDHLMADRCLALTLMDQGEHGLAKRRLAHIHARLHDAEIEPLARLSCAADVGEMYLALGLLDLAWEIARWAERLARDVASPRYVYRLHLLFAACSFLEGDMTAATDWTRRALGQALEASDPIAIGRCQWRLARLLRRGGDHVGAADMLGSAWTRLAGKELRALPEVLGCLIERAIHLADDSPAEAAHLLGVVRARKRDFVLPLAVADEVEPLLSLLRDRLGATHLDQILTTAADQKLPT